MPCSCNRPHKHLHNTSDQESGHVRLDHSMKRLKAVLSQMEGETDSTVQATLDLYKLQAEQHQAEAAALREENSRLAADAAAKERDLELKWRRRLDEVYNSLCKERERAEDLEKRLGGVTAALEEEREHRRQFESRLMKTEAAFEQQTKKAAKQGDALETALKRLNKEKEWRAAAMKYLRTELQTSDDLASAIKSNASSHNRQHAHKSCTVNISVSPGKHTTGLCCDDEDDENDANINIEYRNASADWQRQIHDSLRRYEEHQKDFKTLLAKLQHQRRNR